MVKKTVSYILITLLSLAFLVPFVVMLMSSFHEVRFAQSDPLFWLQGDLTLSNFRYILGNNTFLNWIKNSLIITIIPVFSQMIFAAILGYIFEKKQFPGRDVIFWTFMSMIMIPQQLLIIPKYIMFANIGWINTYSSLIVPRAWQIMGVFLVRQFLRGIPNDLEEAAYIDGANDFQIFFRVILPLSFPVIATVGTFAFVAQWNELFEPLIYLTEESMYPITLGLATLIGREGNFGIEMAGSVISFIPTFLIFIFFQRFFTEGIQMSGIK